VDYAAVIDYLYTCLPMFTRIGKAAYKPDLNNTIALLNILDNPHRHLKYIHVAGTNGKGSVSHLLASVLQEAGYKTGLYTSPHLLDYRERIKINGQVIEKEYIIAFVEKYKDKFDAIEPSFFEWSVALCFQYFYDNKIDIAVIETGLGGRLDSTNVIFPDLSIITNIGLDHTDLLGDTVEKIAVEKAGIMKAGIPAVIGESTDSTKKIFIDKANENKSTIYFADELLAIKNIKYEHAYLQFDIYKEAHFLYHISSPLGGFYQTKNITTLVQSVQVLKQKNYHISDLNLLDGISKVIRNTGLMGRWQVMGDAPLVVCDTAHNVAGMEQIVVQINATPKEHLHIVLGMVSDKNIDGVLAILPTKNTTYYFCKAQIPRALDENLLYDQVQKFNLVGNPFRTVPLAYEAALKNASEKDMIYIGGSTFVVGDLLTYLKL